MGCVELRQAETHSLQRECEDFLREPWPCSQDFHCSHTHTQLAPVKGSHTPSGVTVPTRKQQDVGDISDTEQLYLAKTKCIVHKNAAASMATQQPYLGYADKYHTKHHQDDI